MYLDCVRYEKVSEILSKMVKRAKFSRQENVLMQNFVDIKNVSAKFC